MAVYLTSIAFKNALDSSTVDLALCNIGDKIIIESSISIKTYAINSANEVWNLNNREGYLTTGANIWVTGGDFSKFRIGDNIQITNYLTNTVAGTANIIDKLSDSEIQLDANPAGWTHNQSGNQDVFSVTEAITALNYSWNFIENNEATNYFSKVDGSVQIASITGLAAAGAGTNKPMTFNNDVPYQIGSIVVDEIGLSTNPIYESKFKIKHTTYVTPILLAQDWDDIQADIAPTIFFNTNCLKSVFYYEARYNLTDPNNIQSLVKDDILGNTGWYNEKFNSGLTNYSVGNLNYTDSAAVPIPTALLDGTNYTEFTFDITNTVDSPFVATSTKLVLNFAKAPNDASEYTANGRDMRHNFVWDSALLTCAVAPLAVNGDNYADNSLRSISNLKATWISNSIIRVTGQLVFSGAPGGSEEVFNESDEPRYIFFVSIQDHTKTGLLTDRVTLKIDASKFYFVTEFPNLVTFSSKLIPHEVADYTTGFTQRDTYTEDELVGFSTITKNAEPLVTSFELTKATYKIIAYNTTSLQQFTLESKSIILPSAPVVSGNQFIDIELPKNIRVPSTEIRKNVVFKTGSAANIYNAAYPFLQRWEYWVQALTANPLFFDNTKSLNNLNNEWHHYDTFKSGSDWELRYKIELDTKVNGLNATYSDYKRYESYPENMAGESITATIKTYTQSGTELVDASFNRYILGYDYTRVEARFTSRNILVDPQCVLGIEVYEQGGVTGKRRMSSIYVSDSDTFFIPLTGFTKVKMTAISASIVKAEADNDYNTIQSLIGNLIWKLSARAYKMTPPSIGITDGYGYFKTQDVYLIAENPIDEDTIVLDPLQINCCEDLVWNVLANSGGANPIKDDKTSFLKAFNYLTVNAAVIILIKEDLSEINLTSSSVYGTPYNFGFYTNEQNKKGVGYLVDWKKVFDTLGVGQYKFECRITTIFGESQSIKLGTYCLKEFSTYNANNTVRIETNINGEIGESENDYTTFDFANLNWYSQYRFDGSFNYTNSTYKEDSIKYDNGEIVTIEDEQTPEFLLSLKPIPAYKHDIIRTNVLMADKIYITDYNNKNIDNYYRREVKKNGGYEPKWYPLKTKLASIDLKMKQAFNNLKKFRY